MQNNKYVLITGAAGFLGSALVRRLLNSGHNVIGVDNHLSSMGPKTPNLYGLSTKRFYLHNEDVANPTFLQHFLAFPKGSISHVFNMACPASPPFYQRYPLQTLMTSVVGTNNVLQLAKYHGSKVLHASTSEVYGNPKVCPQPETYWGNVNSCGVRSCYDEGKRAAEALVHDYRKKHNVDVLMARIFNTYGPGMDPDDGRVVTNFLKQNIMNVPYTVYDGSQTRSFCYYYDTVNALMRLMFFKKDTDQFVFNVGNDNMITIEQLAVFVQKISKDQRNIDMYVQKLPEDDPLTRQPDLTLTKSVIDWKPSVDLFHGLTQTLDYMKLVIEWKNNPTEHNATAVSNMLKQTDAGFSIY
jgi:UDP-glucuronate decarboxylase